MPLLPEFMEFAHTLADASGDIIRPLFRTRVAVETKNDASPVTIADRKAELCMRAMIAEHYPDHGIWGEELGPHRIDAKYVWVLDPVDGTKSFIAGIPTFGTLISLVRLGVPVLGIIDQPVSAERWAAQAQVTLYNNAPVRTRSCVDLAHALLSTTSPYLFDETDKIRFEHVRKRAANTVFGYDCYAYAQLASGHIDAVLETGLKPHDFCAIRPVVEGAGGIMTDWHGAPLTLASDGRVVAAGDPRLHQELLALINTEIAI